MDKLDQLCINTLRFLAIDAIEAARSGHPGMPLGAAPTAYALWQRHLKFDPTTPGWFDRDRFILSAGHASALLYALLHCFGFDLSLEDLKAFRQWGSKTPGHPEHGVTPGVEVTTGPLGQGFAMAVGMAIAERYLGSFFNRPDFPVINHYTYTFVSDGDLMEGISHEAASLAGTLRLAKLICLYDDNDVSIEGSTGITFTEDVEKRFTAYDWHVIKIGDANDIDAVSNAIAQAQKTPRPSLIIVRSHIGYGSPKQDSADAHGAPLGRDATLATKKALGWSTEPPFYVPDEVRSKFEEACQRGRQAHKAWLKLIDAYRKHHPHEASYLTTIIENEPVARQLSTPHFDPGDGPIATRSASGKILNALAEQFPMLIGGSADLAPSTKTLLTGYPDFSSDHPEGRNLRFGVRELAMAAILNGISLHGGLVPYGSTFLVFSDYMRPAIRLAAMQQAHVIFVFSHDSIAVGEDGPTHQPVEQLMSLRLIPGLTVLRPADANETAVCWQMAIERRRPVAIVLTRQALPILDPEKYAIAEGVRRGAYILGEVDGKPDVILIATGSEVHLALQASRELAKMNIKARVVSMPSWEIFAEQSLEYRSHVLPHDVPKLSIEAGVTLGWQKFTGLDGETLGLDRFGSSAPGKVVYERLGFSVTEVISRASKLVRS